jgi:hypothetical protein
MGILMVITLDMRVEWSRGNYLTREGGVPDLRLRHVEVTGLGYTTSQSIVTNTAVQRLVLQ